MVVVVMVAVVVVVVVVIGGGGRQGRKRRVSGRTVKFYYMVGTGSAAFTQNAHLPFPSTHGCVVVTH